VMREEHLAAIKQADHEYYDLDNPSMSDVEYDQLRRSYINQYGSEDLNYVPGDVSEGFEKFRHPVPVTSLSKWTQGVNSPKDLLRKIGELWPVEIQPKYDGLTVVAYPNEDGSCRFVTRGLGGEVGEVLPNFIPKYEGPGVNNSGKPIRGEVFITPANFERLNSVLETNGEEPMRNMRNAAAGLLRRKERSPYLDLLSYIVYDMPGEDMAPGEMRSLISKDTEFTFTNGYQYEDVVSTYGRIERFYEYINSLELYPVDGMVIKSCQKNSLKKFGYTGHHPKNSFAWKPKSEKSVTYVRDVIWQMGRFKATPVAIVDPVEIDGATVTKASLHNAEQIRKLGLKIGAKVTIYKANEIIPQIGEVLEPGNKDIILDVCPACGGPLEEVNGQQFCANPQCKERIAQNIAFLGKKDVLDIRSLSIQTARKIVDLYQDTLQTRSDPQNIIFMLGVTQLMWLDGFALKSAENLFAAINYAKRNVELPRFIKALCIPGIGNDIGKILADEFGDLDTMHRMFSPDENEPEETIKKLQTIDGIGQVTARILVSEKFWEAVDNLYKYVTVAPYNKEETSAGDYAGKIFVLTGKMAHPRSYYEELIEKAGGKFAGSVTKATDFLVIEDVDSQSSKAKKARELGTKLISPEELEDMFKHV